MARTIETVCKGCSRPESACRIMPCLWAEAQAQPEEPETLVIFRRWPKAQGGDVLALFPSIQETSPGTCASYQHVGQHGAADLRLCIASTKPADLADADVQALRRELESIGYRLRPIKRSPGWRTMKCARAAHGVTPQDA